MRALKAFLSIAVACYVAYPWEWLAAKDCGAVKNYGGAATPLRWLKSGELELSSDLMMLCRGSGATCTGELRFTLAFDEQHHASVKKVGKTKTEVEE